MVDNEVSAGGYANPVGVRFLGSKIHYYSCVSYCTIRWYIVDHFMIHKLDGVWFLLSTYILGIGALTLCT